jgi:16S rRNA (uracil1498-N3)-methyltransferase
MHRFYLPPEFASGNTLVLDENESHHAANVLRVRPGEIVTVLDGIGNEISCEVQTVSKRSVALAARERKFSPRLPCQITLLQAIPKGKIMDLIIQKATELGAAKIVPLLTERVITQLDAESAEDKREKWQQVAVEAIKQCGQPWLPEIETPVSPKEFLARGETFDLKLVASLQNDSAAPRDFLRDFLAKNQSIVPQNVCIWIGPEGDFTSSEMELIKAAGNQPITLGRLVLRCETAAIFCLSFLNYELQA